MVGFTKSNVFKLLIYVRLGLERGYACPAMLEAIAEPGNRIFCCTINVLGLHI